MKITTLGSFFPVGRIPRAFPRHVSLVRRPPVKCQGIKAKLVRFIVSNVAWDGKGTWFDPFAGSGIVTFNARPDRAVVSDINPHIIDLYNAIKAGTVTPINTRRFLEACEVKLRTGGRTYYEEIRDRFNSNGDPRDFIFLMRSCYNGLMRFNSSEKFNAAFCHKNERFDPAYITKIANQIAWVRSVIQPGDYTFSCRDWHEVVKEVTPGDFVYLDPPYSGRDTGYFGTWTEKDDDDLVEFIRSCKARVALSTWASDEMKENQLYKKLVESGLSSATKNHFYHIGPTEEDRHAVIEALVMNYKIRPST